MKASSRCGIVPFFVALLVLVPLHGAQGFDRSAVTQNAVDPPLGLQAADDGRDGAFVEPKPGHQPGHPLGGWYLGVYGNYTPTGLVLTEVFPRTAAANAGLEIGDRIVAVNGRQIGVILSTRLTLDVVLQQQANRSGWVRLLVQDRRTNQLINIDVRLTRGRVHT